MSTRAGFYILDGVRRALACHISGRKTVPAILYREGRPPQLLPRLKLVGLYSPKAVIAEDSRFFGIVPPIEEPIAVEPLGARGQTGSVPLATVRIT